MSTRGFRGSMRWRGAAGLAALAACTTESPRPLPVPSANVPSSNAPSPNASILPAPMTSARRIDAGIAAASDAASPAASSAAPDAATPLPIPLREDAPVTADTVNRRDLKVGLALEARFSWPELTPALGPDGDQRALAALGERNARSVRIDLAPIGRLRLLVVSTSFPVLADVELRARTDLGGHIVVWPDRRSYRVLQSGTLRSFFNEARADTLELATAPVAARPTGSAFGLPTTVNVLTTDLGILTLTQAQVPGAGDGGTLLCRLLLELDSVAPTPEVCAPELVPVRAEYAWSNGGRLAFEVASLERGAEVDPAALLVPPAEPHFKGDLLPAAPSVGLATAAELRTLRRKDAPGEPADGGVPPSGLLLTNRADVMSYALLDGVPVARVAPYRSVTLTGLRPGTYQVRWTDFLGASPSPIETVTTPDTVSHGGALDAGPSPSP